MKKSKFFILFCGILMLSLLLVSCGGDNSEEVAVMVALTQTAAAQQQPPAEVVPPTASPAPLGFINGTVNLQAPPTPAMMVYALDSATGEWASAETLPADLEGTFSLAVPVGHYQVFAFSVEGGSFSGYTTDGWTLDEVAVSANQILSGVAVRPPGQSECGSMFGVPASPDGRFPAVAGPSEACRAQTQAEAQNSAASQPSSSNPSPVIQPTAIETVQDSPDTTVQSFDIEEIVVDDNNDAEMSGQVSLGMCNNYLLRGFAGLHVDALLQPAGTVALGAWGEDGSVLLSSVAGMNELHVDLPSDQNYTFEVCAIIQGTYSYTLDVHLSN